MRWSTWPCRRPRASPAAWPMPASSANAGSGWPTAGNNARAPADSIQTDEMVPPNADTLEALEVLETAVRPPAAAATGARGEPGHHRPDAGAVDGPGGR